MSADLLIQHFERIDEAPDAVAQLRPFLLDLAVRGRLSERREGEESALLTLTRAHPARPFDPVAGPFTLPPSWVWLRFGDIATFAAGHTPSRNDLSFWDTGEYAWATIADMSHGAILTTTKETVSRTARDQVFKTEPLPIGTMIMSFKLTIGKISRLAVPTYHNEAIISIHPLIPAMDPYLFLVLPERARQGTTKAAIKGATLNRTSLNELLVPLPPVPEQHRIVAKVGELMALCNQLEVAQKERESHRDALRAASLNRLTATEDGRGADSDVRFFLSSSSRLITKPEHVEALRQSILDLAVQGRLVSQNPADEPASELLAQALALKNRLTEEGVSKRNRPPRPILSEQVPGVTPPGWVWTRLQEIATTITKGTTPTSVGHAFTKQGVNFVKVESIRNGELLPEHIASFISAETHEFLGRSRLESGDILFSIAGSIGTCALVTDEVLPANTNQALAIIRGTHVVYEPTFLLICLRSSVATLVVGKARGGAMNNISLGDIRNFVVPVPPLPEQLRIVAMVDDLMALCDEMEFALASAQNERGRLLESLLHQALGHAAGTMAPA